MEDYIFAYELAKRAHSGQVDKAGVSYIDHPVAVSDMVYPEKEKIVALLHDVVEDTGITIACLRVLFDGEIADAVECLTRKAGESYNEYIRRVAQNPIARHVKIADLSHNMDLSRLPVVTDADFKRNEKYHKAMDFLVSVDECMGKDDKNDVST